MINFHASIQCLRIDAYNQCMTKDRDDDTSAGADGQSEDEETTQRENDKDKSKADKTDADETRRFERSDNLRRRSEWFQKRTGGR